MSRLNQEGYYGNFGLYDQYTAIKWVKENIKAFGEDPNNITIMGQSAGVMSVQYHCLSPISEGLFQKAIMCSGGGVSKLMKTSTPQIKDAFWTRVMKHAECKSIEQLKLVDVKYGNPNGEGLPQWQAKKVLCLGEQETAMRHPNIFKQIKTMLTNKAVGE